MGCYTNLLDTVYLGAMQARPWCVGCYTNLDTARLGPHV